MSRTCLWPLLGVDQKDRLSEFFGVPEYVLAAALAEEANALRLATMGDAWLSLVMIQTLQESEDVSAVKGLYTCNQALGRFMTQLIGQGATWNKHRLGDLFESCLYITSHPQVATQIDTWDMDVTDDGHDRATRCCYALKKWVMAGADPTSIITNPHDVADVEALRLSARPVERVNEVKNKMIRNGQKIEQEMMIQEHIKRISALQVDRYSSVLDLQHASDRDASLALMNERSQSMATHLMEVAATEGKTLDQEVAKQLASGLTDNGVTTENLPHDMDNVKNLLPAELLKDPISYFTPIELPWSLAMPQPAPAGANTEHPRDAVRVMWTTRSGKRQITPLFYPCCGNPAAVPTVCTLTADHKLHSGFIQLTRESRLASINKEEPALWSCCRAKCVACAPSPAVYAVIPETRTGCCTIEEYNSRMSVLEHKRERKRQTLEHHARTQQQRQYEQEQEQNENENENEYENENESYYSSSSAFAENPKDGFCAVEGFYDDEKGDFIVSTEIIEGEENMMKARRRQRLGGEEDQEEEQQDQQQQEENNNNDKDKVIVESETDSAFDFASPASSCPIPPTPPNSAVSTNNNNNNDQKSSAFSGL